MFSKIWTKKSTTSYSEQIEQLKLALKECDAILIGAGAGLSTAAGYSYDGKRFHRYFSDFEQKYGFHDMYSGGFYPFSTEEERWAYWSRNIFINRYQDAPSQVYENLFSLVKNKDYFVLTTNVDHCFQKAGFSKERLFYMQGDYGLFQCSEPCCQETYDNKDAVFQMLESQGFVVDKDNFLSVKTDETPKIQIPSALVPKCPHCGKPMTMNLRCDASFVEDQGWHQAAKRYEYFLRTRQGLKILFLELGVGMNTPIIIKYPFWRMTAENPKSTYVCINQGQAYCIKEIKEQSICLNADIRLVLQDLFKAMNR